MAYIIDDNGNITCYQGDTVVVPVTNLDTTQNYTLYLQIRDEDGKIKGNQISVPTLGQANVDMTIPATTTDTLTVPTGEEYKVYYYGIKSVLSEFEDTLMLGANSDFATKNTIKVYPKKVEGI